jgi:hypothetical protein
MLAFHYDGERGTDGTVLLSLAWWLDGPPPRGIDYHTFAHLVDGDGKRWGQQDMSSFPTAYWRTGDLMVTHFQIQTDPEAPSGEYWMHFGMYSYPEVVNVPVLDAAGNPAADIVVVGPILLR